MRVFRVEFTAIGSISELKSFALAELIIVARSSITVEADAILAGFVTLCRGLFVIEGNF